MSVPLLPTGWEQVGARVRSASSIALFLDFDGTLSPLVSDPRDARLDHVTRGALARLARNPRVRVCVISGRRADDLRKKIGLPGLLYLGVHGGDPGTSIAGSSAVDPELLLRVSHARQNLATRLNGSSGVHLEDKGIAFALHYRGAGPDVVHRAGALLRGIVSDSGGQLRIQNGDCVWEVLPSEVRGKGHAARKQWRTGGTNALPIYLGNDSTDEAAFRTLASGITVRVGAVRSSKARYSLRDPAEVRWFLLRLEQEMETRRQAVRMQRAR